MRKKPVLAITVSSHAFKGYFKSPDYIENLNYAFKGKEIRLV